MQKSSADAANPEAEVEFGNELLIAEQVDGFIVDWQLYAEKVADQSKLGDFLERYRHFLKYVRQILQWRAFLIYGC